MAERTGDERLAMEVEYDELSRLMLKGLQGIEVLRCTNRGHPALIYVSADAGGGGIMVTVERTTTTSVRPLGNGDG